MIGVNQPEDYASRRRDGPGIAWRLTTLLLLSPCAVWLAACGGGAPAVIASLDGTFSDHAVAAKCLSDLGRAADLAAERGGSFTFFAYDGDPLSRRGIAVDFGDLSIPNDLKGTSKEAEYRVEKARPVLGEMEELAAERPSLGGTPLLGVLTRIARIGQESGGESEHAVNCGDGLWTDLKPGMSQREVHALAQSIPPGLEGMTIDFVGLSASSPGSGRWVERLRPLVQKVLQERHAHLGVYDIELPADWPQGS